MPPSNPAGEIDTLLLPEHLKAVCPFTSSPSTYHSLHIQIERDLVLHSILPNVGAEGFFTRICAGVACLVELLGNVNAHLICLFLACPLTLRILQTVGLTHLLHCPIISPFPYNYPNFTTVYFVRM